MIALIISVGYIAWCAYRTQAHIKSHVYTWRRAVVFFLSPVIDLLSFIGKRAQAIQDELWS